MLVFDVAVWFILCFSQADSPIQYPSQSYENHGTFGACIMELWILEVEENCLFNDEDQNGPIMFPHGIFPYKCNLTFIKEEKFEKTT